MIISLSINTRAGVILGTVVVTGGAGYIGSALVSRLLDQGINVLSLDNLRRGDYSFLERYKENPLLKLGIVDIRNREQTEETLKAFGDVDVIFHLAAIPGLQLCDEFPEEAIAVNVLGTHYLLQTVRKLGIPKVVFASSAAVYGLPIRLPIDEEHPLKPMNLYGVTKLAGEKLVSASFENDGIETVSLRFANVYGVGLYTRCDTVIPRFVKLALEGNPLTIYEDGKSSRNYVHVSDIAEAVQLFGKADSRLLNGEAFNIGGEKMIVADVARTVIDEVYEATGKKAEMIYLPSRSGEAKEFDCSTNKIRHKLGFFPKRTVREGVKQLVGYHLRME